MHTPVKWVTCLRDYCLMPDPHSEEGAQEYVSLFKHQVSWDSAWPVSPDEGLQVAWELGQDTRGEAVAKAGLGCGSLGSALKGLLFFPS